MQTVLIQFSTRTVSITIKKKKSDSAVTFCEQNQLIH